MSITPTHPDPVRLLSVHDLAERWGMKAATLYTWRTYGKGPKGLKIGKFVRYQLSEVEAYEAEQLAKESA